MKKITKILFTLILCGIVSMQIHCALSDQDSVDVKLLTKNQEDTQTFSNWRIGGSVIAGTAALLLSGYLIYKKTTRQRISCADFKKDFKTYVSVFKAICTFWTRESGRILRAYPIMAASMIAIPALMTGAFLGLRHIARTEMPTSPLSQSETDSTEGNPYDDLLENIEKMNPAEIKTFIEKHKISLMRFGLAEAMVASKNYNPTDPKKPVYGPNICAKNWFEKHQEKAITFIERDPSSGETDTPLYRAANFGLKRLLLALLATQTIDKKEKDDALRTATLCPHCDTYGFIETILKNGASPSLFDAKDSKIVELFLDKGRADPNTYNEKGQTPLMHAIEWCDYKKAQMPDGRTRKHAIIEALLLNKRTKPNLQSRQSNGENGYPEGRTALHVAAQYSSEKVIELLLSKGADINIKDKDNNTPYDIIKKNFHRPGHLVPLPQKIIDKLNPIK